MPNHLRSRSPLKATLYRGVEVADRRGNVQVMASKDDPHVVHAHEVHDRSNRAEVPGQAQVDVITLRIPHRLDGIALYSLAEWHGEWWDVVSPPANRVGTRHTRHTTIQLRWRPSPGVLV